MLGVGNRFNQGKLLGAVASVQQRSPAGVELVAGALHNSSMLSIAHPQGTNIFQLVIGTVLCFK